MAVVVTHRRGVFSSTVPAPPTLFTKVVNSTTVLAIWEPSGKMGQHEGFRLYYRKVHSSPFTGPLTFARNVTQYNITQLGKCVFVRAWGWGKGLSWVAIGCGRAGGEGGGVVVACTVWQAHAK